MKINSRSTKTLLILSFLSLLVSCGSGSSTVSNGSDDPSTQSETGNIQISTTALTASFTDATDLSDYNACYDTNENGSCDSDEPSASLRNTSSSLSASPITTVSGQKAEVILSAASQITYYSEFINDYSPMSHLSYSVNKELGISSSELRQTLAQKLGYTSYSQVPQETIESLNNMFDQILRIKSHISNTQIDLYNNQTIAASIINNRGKLSVILAPDLYKKIDELPAIKGIVATYNNLGSALNLSDSAKILEAQKGYLLEVFGNKLQGTVAQASIIDKKPGKIKIGALPASTSLAQITLSWSIIGNKMNYWEIKNNGKLVGSGSINLTDTHSKALTLNSGVNKINVLACYKDETNDIKTCSAKKVIVQKGDGKSFGNYSSNYNIETNNSLNNAKAIGDSCTVSTASGIPAKSTIVAWSLDTNTTSDTTSIKWNMWWGINGDSWNLCSNDKVVYTGSLTANSNNGNQKAEYNGPILSLGNNKITVQLCNSNGCSTSDAVYVLYTENTSHPDPDPTPTPIIPPTASSDSVCQASTETGIPGKPTLVKWNLNSSTHSEAQKIEWRMWWGVNASVQHLCINNVATTGSALIENGNSAQRGDITANLSSGVNSVKISLCNSIGCSVSDEVVINYSSDSDNSTGSGTIVLPPPAPPMDIDDTITPGTGDDGIGGGGNDDDTPPTIGGGDEQNQTIHKPIFYHTYTVIPVSTDTIDLSWYAIAGKNGNLAFLYTEGSPVALQNKEVSTGDFGNSQTDTFSNVDVSDSKSFYMELCDASPDSTSDNPIGINCSRSETYTLLKEVVVVTPPTTAPPITTTGNLKDCKEARIGQTVSTACLDALKADDSFGGTFDSAIGNDYNNVADRKHIIGYFVEWGVYSRNYHANNIPANYLTHIYYSFLKPSASGEVAIDDTYAALDKRYSDTDSWSSSSPDAGSLKRLWLLKQKFPHLQLCFSIGGWTYSDHFYDIAADATKRKTFAQSALEIAEKYNFDCIDVDWEFPVIGGEEKGTAADKASFTLFMKELHDTLSSSSKGIKLTAAVSANDKGIAALDYDGKNGTEGAAQYMDFISLMTYDYNGAWNKYTGHQSSLFSNDNPSESLTVGYNPKWNIDGSLKVLKKQVSNQAKVAIGIAFYGRTWSGVSSAPNNTQPIVSATGAGVGSFEKGVVDYKHVRKNTAGALATGNTLTANGKVSGNWTYTWDDEAKASSLYNSINKNYITYTSPKAIYLQSCYAKHNAGGVIIWELSGDHIANDDPNEGGELLKEVRGALRGDTFSLDSAINCDSTPVKGATLASGGGSSSGGGNDDSVVYTNTNNGTSDTTLGSIISEARFNKMFPNRNGKAKSCGLVINETADSCTTRDTGALTYKNLLKAATYYPGFGNIGSDDIKLLEVASFLANTAHETTGGWGSYDIGTTTRYKFGYYYDQELCGASGSCGHKYCQSSNSSYGSLCDGSRSFHGRGPIQLSWNYNYGMMAAAIGHATMATNPDVVLTEPGLAFRTALWFWMTAQAPKPSAHSVMTGQWIPSEYDADASHSGGRRASVFGRPADPSKGETGFGMTANIINGGLECGFESSKVKNRIGHLKTFTLILQDLDPYAMTQTEINANRLVQLIDDNPYTKCNNMASY